MPDTKVSALTVLSVPALEDYTYAVDDVAGTPLSRALPLDRLGGLFDPATCNGRLTTESGVPVSTSDRTSQSTLYFTPYNGNRVALYDGTRWKLYTFTERSLALSSLTSGKNYDVFLYDNAGTLTLELSAAWTNDTTRADALTTQDGIYVKSGATTRRYLGTIRTTSTTTTEDSAVKRFVWNAVNRRTRKLQVTSAASNYTYNSATVRQANADTSLQADVVAGLAGESALALAVSCTLDNPAGNVGRVGFGEDSTTAFSTESGPYAYSFYNGTINSVEVRAQMFRVVPLGRHYYTWLEVCDGTGGNVTFQIATAATSRRGVYGTFEC